MDQLRKGCKMRLPAAVLGLVAAGALAQTALAQTSVGPRSPVAGAPADMFLLRGATSEAQAETAADPFEGSPLPDEERAAAAEAAPEQETVPLDLSDEGQARALPEPREPAVTDPVNTGTPDTRANVAAPPVEAGAPRVIGEDPFAATGFRLGTFIGNVRLEQALGYSTNSTFAVGGKPGLFSQTDGVLSLRSDWSRHEAGIEAVGSLRRAIDVEDSDQPSAGVDAHLRLDLIDGFTSTLRGAYAYTTEAANSETLTEPVATQPGVHRYGASLEVARTGGLLDLLARGSIDRTTYDTADLEGGGTLDQADRNNNFYRLTSRVAYGPTPALKPFVEGSVGWRVHDEAVDRNGQRRDSVLYELRAGVEFDLSEKLVGEIAVGYGVEDYRDSTLNSLSGFTLNGTLDWSPERDTIVRLVAATEFGGSTVAGDSGSVDYSVQLRAERRVRDNLALNALGAYSIDVPESGEPGQRSYTVGAGVEYWVSRFLSLTADVEYQDYDGGADNRWDAASVRVGVAVQR